MLLLVYYMTESSFTFSVFILLCNLYFAMIVQYMFGSTDFFSMFVTYNCFTKKINSVIAAE